MKRTAAARWTAVAGLVAVVSPAVRNVYAYLGFVVVIPGGGSRFTAVVTWVGAVAALVALVLALRRRDVPTSVVAGSVLVLSVGSRFVGGAITGSVVYAVAQLLLIAFGVLLLRRTAGAVQVLPWTVVVCGGLWLVVGAVFTWVYVPGLDQRTLVLLTQIPGIAMTLAYLAAAALFVPPLVRPVGAGVRRLWASADVR